MILKKTYSHMSGKEINKIHGLCPKTSVRDLSIENLKIRKHRFCLTLSKINIHVKIGDSSREQNWK